MMIAVLHCLLGYHLFENRTHEILGILFFALFLIHNGLNASRYRFLLRGRGAFPAVRCFVIALLWLCMAANIGSAVFISRDIFPDSWFLPGVAVARRVHMVATAWSFVLMNIHLGFHIEMFIGIGRRLLRRCPLRALAVIGIGLRLTAAASVVYGAIAFVLRKMYSDLFLLSEFKFMDFGENFFRFFLDSFCMMMLFIVLGFFLKRESQKLFEVKNEDRNSAGK